MQFKNIRGSIVAMITPFHEDGSVNFDALTALIERQITAGSAAILTLGTTGEYPTMTEEENDAVVRHTIRTVAGRVPVIVGSGSNCTAKQIANSKRYEAMGAD
ncbi:dihydrodipicolinate synthase, partial [gut metagenome]